MKKFLSAAPVVVIILIIQKFTGSKSINLQNQYYFGYLNKKMPLIKMNGIKNLSDLLFWLTCFRFCFECLN
jgi:hypothetical protein